MNTHSTETRSSKAIADGDSQKDAALGLNAAFENGDPRTAVRILAEIARAKGTANIARKVGSGRDHRTTISAQASIDFASMLKLIHALGFKLRVKPTSQ